jgi:DNA primase
MSILYEIHQADVNSKLYSKYVATICPWHDYSTVSRSLLIYEDTYKCLSCGRWGKSQDYLDQLQSHHIIPRLQKKQSQRNPFSSWMKERTLFQVLKTAYKALKNYPQQGEYLRKRKLTEETIKKIKCGYLEGFYTIPIINPDGIAVGALARAGESIEGVRYFVPNKQDPNLLFSPDWGAVLDSKEVYLTFGVFDAIAIWQCGKPAISTTCGKRLNPVALQDFRKKIKIFPDFEENVDAMRLAKGLGWRGQVVNYQYPFGTKDPNDLYRQGLLQGALQ